MNTIFKIIFISFFTSGSARAAQVCLLSFERAAHPISRYLEKNYSQSKNIFLQIEATPADVFRCLDLKAKRIVLVAHAVTVHENHLSSQTVLGYFKRFPADERKVYLDQAEKYYSFFLTEYSLENQPNAWSAEAELLRIKNYRENPSIALYGPIRFFMDHFFDVLGQRLQNQGKEFLKEISIMSCQEQDLRHRYPQLKHFETLGIKIAFAPKNNFLSFMLGREVTSFDKNWIQKALTIK